MPFLREAFIYFFDAAALHFMFDLLCFTAFVKSNIKIFTIYLYDDNVLWTSDSSDGNEFPPHPTATGVRIYTIIESIVTSVV